MQRIALSLILVACSAQTCGALVSTNVPLDHWSYDAIEKLANYALIDSSMLGIRPLSRLEMARQVGQAMHAIETTEESSEMVHSIVERLQREYEGELILLGVLDGWYGESFIKPIEDPYVTYRYAEDTPDLENRRGDELQEGSNYRAGFASRVKLFEWAAFYVHPEYLDSSEIDGNVDFIEAYGKVMTGPIEIEVGKDSLWWGPGRHGSMLMSSNVQPFTMVKVTNPQPLPLPWIFRILGPFRGEWFFAELEEDRDIPEARLSGIRLNIKPHPCVELGASRVAMFGGRGVPRVDFVDYAKMFFALTDQEENNQLAGFDISVLLPLWKDAPLRSIRFYADAAGEDESGGWPSKWGELLGLQFNDILKTGRTDLRVEYANNRVSGFGELFYTHSLYTSGYTYEGRIIGHHMGSDSRDVFVHLAHYLTEDVVVDLAFDQQTYGLGGGARTTTDIFECGVTLFPSPLWRIRTGYRYEETSGVGADGDNHIVELGLIRRF